MGWLLADPAVRGPRTWLEATLLPFYLLVLLTSLQILATAPPSSIPASPAWLDVCAVGVGILGFAYPSRYLAVALLCAFWFATAIAEFTSQTVMNVGSLLVVVVLSGLFVTWAVLVERARSVSLRSRKQLRRSKDYSTFMAAFLPGPLAAIRSEAPLTVPGTAGTETAVGLRPVEVSRHFDSDLEASITGGFRQWMRDRGLGVGVGIGAFSFGAGRGRSWGGGQIELGAQGTIHEDIVNDSFTAVLRLPIGSDDIIRIVVPSAPAVQEYVRQLIWEWQRRLTVNSKAELAVRVQLNGLADRLVCDTSYAGDRLSALARASSEQTVSIVGAPLGGHALLAAAVQFSANGEWVQLFPVALVNAIIDLMHGRLPTPPSAPTPPAPLSGAPVADSSASNGEFHALNGEQSDSTPSRRALSVATIGTFRIDSDGADLTGSLVQKPVASFIWLYLLARSVRNPKDAMSRAALADEVFPNLDSKQQRTRLRQRLSDMQANLPRSLAGCLAVDSDRLSFVLGAIDVDAAALRRLATTLASRRGSLPEPELAEAERLLEDVGDASFLPEWEVLESKVTQGRSGASSVIDEVRADVDRWRASLLVAVGDAYSARNRPVAAIPYLERVVRQQPDNESAVRKLRAAYLESGQPVRATELDTTPVKPRR